MSRSAHAVFASYSFYVARNRSSISAPAWLARVGPVERPQDREARCAGPKCPLDPP